MKLGICSLIFIVLCIFSCKKEKFNNSKDALFRTSVDELLFDTLFTNTGSVTKTVKLYNDNLQNILLNYIKLKKGKSSPFVLNINGINSSEASKIVIASNDSIYLFVQVSLAKTDSLLPFLMSDSIEVSYNGIIQFVKLEAWGQNAIVFNNKKITENEQWDNTLPYIINGFLYVAENSTLTIQKGAKVFVHAHAIVAIDGTLIVNGSSQNKVVFTGSRLDKPYSDYPASWPGILFTDRSKNNNIQFAEILNAHQAIQVDGPSVNNNPKLTLTESKINNAYDAGIIAVNSNVFCRNVLVTNCRRNIMLLGGVYTFTHCTVATYYNEFISDRVANPVLYITSKMPERQSIEPVNATFINCIFWGEKGNVMDDEVWVEKEGNKPFSVIFDHVLWKQKNSPKPCTIINPIANINPVFDSIGERFNYFSFKLRPESPAVDKAKATNTSFDIDFTTRPKGIKPDIGCYESF